MKPAMTLVFWLLLCAWLFAQHPAQQIADLAPEWRRANWRGSCGHASTTSALRWLQLFGHADQWWATYRGGENLGRHRSRLQAQGLRYIGTDDGDLSVLEYAIQTRRGAIVYWPPDHIVNFVGRVSSDGKQYAVILDNENVSELRSYEWNDWLSSWRDNGGLALVIIDGFAPPPVPE
jgi:hypothetical protein